MPRSQSPHLFFPWLAPASRVRRAFKAMKPLILECSEDQERKICVGYKDLRPDEFWARGHMPNMPLMPGVIMCEAAAQVASYYSHKYKLMEGIIGFGGNSWL